MDETIHPWISEQKVRAGITLLDSCSDWKMYVQRVLLAESLGYDSVWVSDHPTLSMDTWSILGILSQATKHLRLGSLVACDAYRNPVMLARQAADIDRISEGRLVLGLGIGDMRQEFEMLGMKYPSIKIRQDSLEESVKSIQQTWRLFQ